MKKIYASKATTFPHLHDKFWKFKIKNWHFKRLSKISKNPSQDNDPLGVKKMM